jgi:hydroxymethylpyrimidine pyrophosphatase-like HAD family hydrolase
MCKYSNRLYKEWIAYGKIILSVDFDDTLYPWGLLQNDKDRAKTIKLVKKAKGIGAYIVIFTASDKERYNEIIKYCKALGIDIDTINQNPIDLPFGNNGGKIFYNHNLCDRSGLTESLRILKKAMKRYRKYKQKIILTS